MNTSDQEPYEFLARTWGWVTIANLQHEWDNSPLARAIREVVVDIDDRIADAWGPDSALRFWNSQSGEYSHAADWIDLCDENGLCWPQTYLTP